MRISLFSCALALFAVSAAGQEPAPATKAEGERLLATATHLLGIERDEGKGPTTVAGQWEAIHAVEGDGLMQRGIAPEICAAAEAQASRAAIRLLVSCHRDGAASTLIVFVPQ